MIDWQHWHNEPYLVGGLVLLGWLYALCTGPLRTRIAGANTPYPRDHALRFYLALILFYLAVGSPLDQAGERFLLSAHMVQHQLIIYGSAVLMLLGTPAWLIRPLTDHPSLDRLGKLFSNPVICGLIYTLTLTLWHVPSNYDWALRSKPVHILEHVMFFGAALFYWWPVLSPSIKYPPRSHAIQLMYLVAVTIGMTPLFSFLAFSDNILYPTYEYAPRIIAGFDASEDQLLGAAIMKLGGLFVTFLSFIIVFYQWYQRTENTPARHSV